jgi:hypothetical protein
MSLHVRSRLNEGTLDCDLNLPQRNLPAKTQMRFRLPQGWHLTSATTASQKFTIDPDGTLDISSLRGKTTLTVRAEK